MEYLAIYVIDVFVVRLLFLTISVTVNIRGMIYPKFKFAKNYSRNSTGYVRPTKCFHFLIRKRKTLPK